MPDLRRSTRAAAALAAGLAAVVLAGPVALAQSDDGAPSEPLDPGLEPPTRPEQHPPGSWAASRFEPPFDDDDTTLRRATFDIEGTLRYQKTGPADFIEEVEVRVVDDPADSFAPGDGCSLPPPTTIAGDGPRPGLTAEQAFAVEDVSVPCNGRYLVEAEGWLEDPDADAGSYTLSRSFVLAAMPASVGELGVRFDGSARSVSATFQPLADDELAPDAIGYVLERRGDDGDFVDVATIGPDDEPELVDPLTDVPAGSYTYRVRAVRAGVDGEVRSSLIDTETDTVEVEGEPRSADPPSTTSGRAGTSGQSTGGRVPLTRTSSAPRLTTPTTLDTGFEDTLDYGDRGESELAGDEPVAGQSIVRDEGEGIGLAVPAAGALVMLGWAGHILYLNRLAKQL